MAKSAPRDRQSWHFSSVPAVTKTLLAPKSLAIWIVARPTPDAPASEGEMC
jgi:hypothetical protein